MKVPVLDFGDLVLRPFKESGEDDAIYRSWFESHELCNEMATESISHEEMIDIRNSYLVDENKFDFLIVDKKSGELIGDIGYFFELDDNGNVDFSSGEISMMIADRKFRGKGAGRNAYESVLCWAKAAFPNLNRIVAKIKDDNTASIEFFKKLGYIQTKHVAVFQEVTYEKVL